MINLWKYEVDTIIKITDIDDTVFVGAVDQVADAEEYPDNENNEDGITIRLGDALVEFMQSDIKSIEVVG